MRYTIKDIFLYMRKFLEIYYISSQSDDLGALLGDTMFFEEGNSTADPAAWFDWKDSILKVTGGFAENMYLNVYDSYLCIVEFIDRYGRRINSVEVSDMISEMKMIDKDERELEYWRLWKELLKETNVEL